MQRKNGRLIGEKVEVVENSASERKLLHAQLLEALCLCG